MKNFLKMLLVTVAVFSFSFTAIAETTIKTDESTSINLTQTKASPVVVAAVASPGDFIGVTFDYSNALSAEKSLITDNAGAIQISNIQTSNRYRKTEFDYVNPPSERRKSFDKTLPDRLGKSPLKQVFRVYLARQFVSRL